jgi:hypothetical protein
MGCEPGGAFVGFHPGKRIRGVIMRIANFSWGLCAAVVIASAAQAGVDEPFGALDDSPRFMLYVQKQVGAPRHKSAGPSFGFAVGRQSAPVFDLRVAPFDHGAIMLNGFQLTGQQGLGFDSYGSDSWHNPWLWVGLGLGGALGISCATDNWPCDGGGYDGNDDYQVPGT